MSEGAFDYVDFQFKLSQIPLIARYEAIRGVRPDWIASSCGFAMTMRQFELHPYQQTNFGKNSDIRKQTGYEYTNVIRILFRISRLSA
ncbi:MAG: hypothetical protein LBS88_10390 [Tannerellaceae bacterium]|nr:hypothetical protein [Tannerellaceae bacterium]